MNFPQLDIPSIFSPIYGKLRQYDEDLAKLLQELLSSLSRMFSRGVSVTANLDVAILSYTSNAVPNTEDTVAHTLKRVPAGFIVVDANKGGIVYRGGTTFTTENIYLKCTVASTALKVLVY